MEVVWLLMRVVVQAGVWSIDVICNVVVFLYIFFVSFLLEVAVWMHVIVDRVLAAMELGFAPFGAVLQNRMC